jgi:threonine dehydratase
VVVEPADADDLRRSLAARRVVANEAPSTSACDGLRNTSVGDLNWRILSRLGPATLVVRDEDVARALALLEKDGLGPVEPSGAAAAAALVLGAVGSPGDVVVAVVSGGNAAASIVWS